MGADANAAGSGLIDWRLGEIMGRLAHESNQGRPVTACADCYRSLTALREDLRAGKFGAPERHPDLWTHNLIHIQYRPFEQVWTASIIAPFRDLECSAGSPAGALLMLSTGLVLHPEVWRPKEG